MKQCCKCRVHKPVTEFYRRQKYKDGLDYECKACTGVRTALWRKKHREKVRATFKTWVKNNKAKVYKYVEVWRKNNPEKASAHTKLHNAVRSGIVKREACEVCGAGQVDAHHDNYNEPLNVRWLCRQHHNNLRTARE